MFNYIIFCKIEKYLYIKAVIYIFTMTDKRLVLILSKVAGERIR
jgi:hypothetical protein